MNGAEDIVSNFILHEAFVKDRLLGKMHWQGKCK